MKVLLDTCVLAELRSAGGHPQVKEAVSQILDDSLYLSVLTVGEIAKGIALLESGRKRQALTSWFNGLVTQFSDRILSIDLQTAQLWGELTAKTQRNGIVIPAVDGLLCATALRHGMSIMTRNTRHFHVSGALIVDPWQVQS